MNTPVSFKISRLLKEKAKFDMITSKYYEYALTSRKDSETNDYGGSFGWKEGETNLNSGYFSNYRADLSNENWYMCSAPTIADVIMWLYKRHKIWIVSSYKLNKENHKKEWFWFIIKDGEQIAYRKEFNSNIEAYSVAIEYALDNLI